MDSGHYATQPRNKPLLSLHYIQTEKSRRTSVCPYVDRANPRPAAAPSPLWLLLDISYTKSVRITKLSMNLKPLTFHILAIANFRAYNSSAINDARVASLSAGFQSKINVRGTSQECSFTHSNDYYSEKKQVEWDIKPIYRTLDLVLLIRKNIY